MKLITAILLFLVGFSSNAQIMKTYTIDGSQRKAIVYLPTNQLQNSPVVFVFHGHGGNALFASRRIDFQNHYKDAIVVFMQGIPGRKIPNLDPKGTMNGWQVFPDELGNRDVKFFDAVLKDLQQNYSVDESRISVVGHSNGARFVNVLWKERGSLLSAIISVSAQGGEMIRNLEPLSVWMYMGENDKTVPFETQKKTVPIVMENLKVDKNSVQKQGDKMVYKGAAGTELVVEEKEAGHEFPKSEIPEMVKFLKGQKRF